MSRRKLARSLVSGIIAAMAMTAFAASPAVAACVETKDASVLVCAETTGDPTPRYDEPLVICGGSPPCLTMGVTIVESTTASVTVEALGTRTTSEVPVEERRIRITCYGSYLIPCWL